MLSLSRKTGAVSDLVFRQLPDLLNPADRLVFNDTKVIPARLFCKKEAGGKVELLFTERSDDGCWNVLVRPGRGVAAGTTLHLENAPEIAIQVTAVNPNGSREVCCAPDSTHENLSDVVARYGVMPLPHYIRRSARNLDNEAYQTIFAENEGAIAAPTAGLHFTQRLLDALKARGIFWSRITLHVGVGTFRPVRVADPIDHVMHVEQYNLPEKAAVEINQSRKSGGRVIAVGTTVVRVLEHCGSNSGILAPSRGSTGLKILPGHPFSVVDGIITNFHVPRSTLLMLVSAFAGTDRVLGAYAHAVKERYRFFSYGDAMIIL